MPATRGGTPGSEGAGGPGPRSRGSGWGGPSSCGGVGGALTSRVVSAQGCGVPSPSARLPPDLSLLGRPPCSIPLLPGVPRFGFLGWVKVPFPFRPRGPPSHPATSPGPSLPGCAPSRSASTSSRGAPRISARASGGSMSTAEAAAIKPQLRRAPPGWEEEAPPQATPRPPGPPVPPQTWAPGQDLPLPREDLPALCPERLPPFRAPGCPHGDQQPGPGRAARQTSPAGAGTFAHQRGPSPPPTRGLCMSPSGAQHNRGPSLALSAQPAAPSLTSGLELLLPVCPGRPLLGPVLRAAFLAAHWSGTFQFNLILMVSKLQVCPGCVCV